MKKLIIIFFLFNLTQAFAQEKKLLLRYTEITTSELDLKSEKFIEKSKKSVLGTILVYSKSVIVYDEKSGEHETYKIDEVQKGKARTLYIATDKKWIFALTNDKKYFTQIGKKERLIYQISQYKYAEE